MKRLASFNRKFEEATLCIGVIILAVILIANVVAREFFESIYFVEEVSMFLIFFVTFVGLPYGVRKAKHIRMAAIFDLMNKKTQKILILIISFTSALVMFFMTYHSAVYVLKIKYFSTLTPALNLPYWLFVVVVPVGFFSGGVQYILTLLKNISERETWLSPEEQREYKVEV
jgi:TRAP-type C4-dicarboxylate transport system permease small subunit